jgi:hypothetical protein
VNWEAIGAIAELLSSLAVFLTLIYLAVQVRHARQDVRRSVRQNRAEVSRERLRIRATDQRLNQLMVKAQESFGDDVQSHPFIAALIEKAQFNPSDAWAVFMELNAEWQYRVQVVANVEELSDGERLEFDNTVRAMYGTRALTQVWYQTHGRNLDPEVVAYVDRLLQSPNNSMGLSANE